MLHDSGTILRLQSALLSQKTVAACGETLVGDLAVLLGCERVSLGFLCHGYAKLVASSSGSHFDARQDELARIAAAMDEAIDQATIVNVPGASDARYISRANAELQRSAGGVCSVPLVSSGAVVGALTLERSQSPFSDEETGFFEALACLVGPLLSVKRDAERSALQRAADATRATAARLFAPGNRPARLVLGAGLLLLAAATLVPLPYRISAPARLEGSMQRVVVAPADGFLQQVNVRPGDVVREKQVLAELAADDLSVELRKRESERLQHENAYQAALARADRTLLVINKAKAAEVQAQVELIENQLDRAQIRAPFDGVVIKGDLSQSLGAPVQRGEVLLTLAPSEQFRLIVEVDERDIAHVRSGQTGRLALAAMPYQPVGLVVERVMPVATSGEGRNFFEVEARIEAPHGPLRPGLKGVAKLDAGARPVVWMLTHRLLDWLRLAFWSIGF